jgi:hypothetical protein
MTLFLTLIVISGTKSSLYDFVHEFGKGDN